MNELSNYLVKSILEETAGIENTVVVYPGRFQPFHKEHYATYQHLVKKFGKNNVYIGTSNKTDNKKSPFNFKEKVMVMGTMFGIPKNKIVQVKNPYAPTEILKKFDKDTTLFITVVGKKDASRLGGKYFTPYKDNLDFEGYRDKGYVYVAPEGAGGVSGTEVRRGLKSGSDEDKKKFFTKRAYPKFNQKIFDFIVDKLATLPEISENRIFIPKEIIEDWLVNGGTEFIKETFSQGADGVDDGPNFLFPNYAVYSKISRDRAEQIGYEVLDNIMSADLTDIDTHPEYPNGPVKAVTPYEAGVIGRTTATNQKDFGDSRAYRLWYKHVTRPIALVGYSLVAGIDIEDYHGNDYGDISKSDGSANDVKENIKIPVKVGDTILTGRFKNKKTIIKNIGKDEHGMPTINGRKVVNFRIVKEGVQVQLDEIPMADLKKIDQYADKQLNPVDVVLTDKHFFDRLQDPRNKKDISQAELIGFFKRLGKNKKKFVDFLNQFGQIVAKDNRSKINIPFIKRANKAIAKTVMRKDNFMTSSPEYTFEGIDETDFGKTPYVVDLEDLTIDNDNFRTTKWTGDDLQMTLMSIGDEIGLERHENGDQFIRVEEGEGKVVMGLEKDNLDFEKEIKDDVAIFIPEGYWHNIINTGDTPLKVYAIYAPPEHPKGKVDELHMGYPSKEDVEKLEKRLKSLRKQFDKEKKDLNFDKSYAVQEGQIDAGEPETGYIPDGKKRKFGKRSGRPEPWFDQLGYTQVDYPKADRMRGRGKGKDTESSFRKVYYKTKNVKVSKLKQALKPVGSNEWPEVIKEATSKDIVKDLDKVKNDLLKQVAVLVAKKKKLYSNMDIESPMSSAEKKLDKDIADLWSQINKLVRQKRSIKEANAVSGGKVHKFITGINLPLDGKRYKEIEFELVKIDNSTERVTLKVLSPKKLFGKEVNVKFRTLRRGPFIKTDTNINELITEGKSFVICRECGEKMKQIQYRHLKYSHDMTLNEYKEKHPNAPLVCETAKNIGDKNPMKNDDVKKNHLKSVNTDEYKKKISKALIGKNKGNKRPDVVEKNKDKNFRKKISEGVKKSYKSNPNLKKQRSEIGKKYGFGNQNTIEKLYESGKWTRPENKDEFQLYVENVRNLTNLNYQTFFSKIKNAKKRSRDFHLDHKYTIREGYKNNIPVEVISHYKNLQIIDGRLNESKGGKSSIKLNELLTDIQNSSNQLDDRILLLCGGAYGHMNHPFDKDVNLTFGQLKDIVNKALTGELNLTREKTDGQALAISWRDDRGLIAARNKSHLKNSGENALDIKGVATKFKGRGELEKAYNFAMRDLENAVSNLSSKQRKKIFKDGSCFMNLEVIYPTSVNVIPYGASLLVFHGTMEYDEDGNAIGENQAAARTLAGMIKQIEKNVQTTYTIQGPPIIELPKSQNLSSKKSKYNGMINKLQKEFGLKDSDGVAEYHQAWWNNWIEKNAPSKLDETVFTALLKRWAFDDKSFRLNKKNIEDDEVLSWARKTDKMDKQRIEKENINKFEKIFLGLGSDILEFTSSVLTVSPDKATRDIKDRVKKAIKDIKKSGDPSKIRKLKLELERLNQVGGLDKIVPNEGIVFTYNGKTMKLTGSFASVNQLLGLMYY